MYTVPSVLRSITDDRIRNREHTLSTLHAISTGPGGNASICITAGVYGDSRIEILLLLHRCTVSQVNEGTACRPVVCNWAAKHRYC